MDFNLNFVNSLNAAERRTHAGSYEGYFYLSLMIQSNIIISYYQNVIVLIFPE